MRNARGLCYASWHLTAPTIRGSGARSPMSPRTRTNAVQHCVAWSLWYERRLRLHQERQLPRHQRRNHRPLYSRLPRNPFHRQPLQRPRQHRRMPYHKQRLRPLLQRLSQHRHHLPHNRRQKRRTSRRRRHHLSPHRRPAHSLRRSIRRRLNRCRLPHLPSADTTGSELPRSAQHWLSLHFYSQMHVFRTRQLARRPRRSWRRWNQSVGRPPFHLRLTSRHLRSQPFPQRRTRSRNRLWRRWRPQRRRRLHQR